MLDSVPYNTILPPAAVVAASPNPYRGRPAAFRSAPTPVEEDSSDEPHATAPTEPVPEPPPAPGSDADPSRPSSSARHRYRTTIPSEAALARRHDAPTSLLMMKGCLGSLWAESMSQMGSAPPLVQMDSKELRERVSELELQLNDPAQASYALRAEIQALTNQTDRQKKSLSQVKDELRAVKEERAASEAGYQQQLAHQAQEIQSKDTLPQERNQKLEVQAAQLETQAAELRALRA
ncbi:MAP7 domain-containing protein 1-like [Zingiber officinale]|uniref:MAP7 domain-containing protein 1-like n=1 Tax=Zingiber officinale TaxID=94328 RepID=UPI001C4DB3B4|nr:MAP7 domain-containing protein 1-like [Zingiber officinale]